MRDYAQEVHVASKWITRNAVTETFDVFWKGDIARPERLS